MSELFAGRVFFEDGILQSEPRIIPKDNAHPALSPNPTSYQLYLLQNDKNKLKHYDIMDAKIRGYKLYWHRNYDWRATDSERKLKNVVNSISPVDKGAKFLAKIRFQNLTKAELGAILEIFNLAKDGAKFKLGWGKSMGLGSVDIKAKLFVENTNKYADLFDENGWSNPCEEKSFDEYLAAFENFVKENKRESDWSLAMRNLALMLEWNESRMKQNAWKGMTTPMKGSPQKDSESSDNDTFDQRFTNRTPLMSLDDVRKKFNI